MALFLATTCNHTVNHSFVVATTIIAVCGVDVQLRKHACGLWLTISCVEFCYSNTVVCGGGWWGNDSYDSVGW